MMLDRDQWVKCVDGITRRPRDYPDDKLPVPAWPSFATAGTGDDN